MNFNPDETKTIEAFLEIVEQIPFSDWTPEPVGGSPRDIPSINYSATVKGFGVTLARNAPPNVYLHIHNRKEDGTRWPNDEGITGFHSEKVQKIYEGIAEGYRTHGSQAETLKRLQKELDSA